MRVKLEQMSGWQCMVKRGAHTPTHRQNQIMYIAPGGMLRPGSPEYENGKELKSTVFHCERSTRTAIFDSAITLFGMLCFALQEN